ncbi:hypothetical protein RJ639_034629 [Escallonia herrerae]|uniref:Uncharacterized protein n=1 Tax=Escallonia herrerae TaxID=1293975 RepID=A0AA88X2P0_9ASTE|nr:hypothetical protein RJ639_034629 [Escallonia herrerae]
MLIEAAALVVLLPLEHILAQKNVTTYRNLMQAFRRLYEAVGLGWVYAITKYEPAYVHYLWKLFMIPD